MRRPSQMQALWFCALLFVAACIAIAEGSGAWFAPGPRIDAADGPPVIEGERLLGCLPGEGKRSGPIREGVRLYANVDLTFRVVTRRAGQTHLAVVARGRPLDGIWPLLTVHVDGEYRGRIPVETRRWWLYRLNLHLAPGEHHFRLSYVNDRPGFPARRDVDLRLVALGDPPQLDPAWVSVNYKTPLPPPAHGPLRLSRLVQIVRADGFDLDSGSDLVEGARALWSEGYIGRTVEVADAGTWRLTIRARADLCGGAGPRVVVLADADQLAELRFDSEILTEQNVDLILEPGTHEILLAYVNDRFVPGVCDRNLHVSELRFEPLAPSPAEAE